MIRAIIQAVEAIGGGGESSPLSPTSQFSELLRVIQFAIAAGIWYLIHQVKKTHQHNDEAHGEVQRNIAALQQQVDSLQKEIQPFVKAHIEQLSS